MSQRPPERAAIVVAVGRGGSEAAARVGAREAHRTGRPLTLVHVAPTMDGWDGQLGRDTLRVAAERAVSSVGGALTVRPVLRHGSLLPELTEAARGAHLLVLERRRAADQRYPATSTTVCLAGASTSPVLMVPVEWLGSGRGVISVGVDPRAPDDLSIRDAMLRARLAGAVLRVLVAVDNSDWSLDELRALMVARLERLGSDACDLAVEIVPGLALEALMASASRSDLLVLGHPRPGRPHGLGPVAARVLREAACPVLVSAPGSTPAAGHSSHPSDEDAAWTAAI